MKKRMGFVSNSSSSSFVLFTTKEVMDKALSKCTEIQKEAVEHYIFNKGMFFDKELSEFSYYHSSDETADFVYDTIDKYFPKRKDDDYSQIDKLTDFIFEGGFRSIIDECAKELEESVLSHYEDC